MKIICEYPPGTLRNATGVNNVGSIARSLKVMPGVGRPFMAFATLPGLVTTVIDWDICPVVSEDEAVNAAAINDQLANPMLSNIVIP